MPAWGLRSAFQQLIVVLVIGVLTSSFAQSLVDPDTSGDTVCLVTPYDPFPTAPPPPPEPICLPSEAPPPPSSDDFLSFEEWKSLKLEETAVPIHDSVTNPNPNDPIFQPDVPSDFHTPTSLGGAPLPSLRVPLTDRFNYASSECSARIQKMHKSVKSPWSILTSKRDKYMLSPCSVRNKFVVVELCDDIQIDTVQLANFEFFSGVFKDITISASQTYDAENWHFLESFRAKNIRTIQSFMLPRDSRFFRYIKIDFTSHYGSEYYCPISLLRVYGLTQIEAYKWEEWQSAWQREHEARGLKLLPSEASFMEASVEILPKETLTTPAVQKDRSSSISAEFTTVTGVSHSVNASTIIPSSSITQNSPQQTPHVESPSSESERPTPTINELDERVGSIMDQVNITFTSAVKAEVALQVSTSDIQHFTRVTRTLEAVSTESIVASPSDSAPHSQETTTGEGAVRPSKASVAAEKSTQVPSSEESSTETSLPEASSSQSRPVKVWPGPDSIPQQNSTVPNAQSQSTTVQTTVVTISTQTRPSASSMPGSGSPGSESIYRTIMNRLTVLESNSSLGVRYMEEQTKYVREALKRLEKDVGRLETLSNQQQVQYRRVMTEIQQHKRDSVTERAALLSQLNTLNDEILLEKRLGLAQLCLLSIVLVFMAFTRSASLGTSVLDGISASDGMIARARKSSGVWRSIRTKSDPDRPKIPAVDPLSESAKKKPQSPPPSVEASSSTSAAQVLDIAAPTPRHALGTPFVLRSAPNPSVSNIDASTSTSSVKRPKFPVDLVSPRGQAYSDPSITPAHIRGGSTGPSTESSTPSYPQSSRRALAKTAHLHEVGRRRRISGNMKSVPATAHLYSIDQETGTGRGKSAFSSGDENDHLGEHRYVDGEDVFVRPTLVIPSSPGGRSSRRPRSRPRSAILNQRGGLIPSPSSISISTAFSHHSHLSPPRNSPRGRGNPNPRIIKAIGGIGVDVSSNSNNGGSGNVSGSDVWEDTDDAGDASMDDATTATSGRTLLNGSPSSKRTIPSSSYRKVLEDSENVQPLPPQTPDKERGDFNFSSSTGSIHLKPAPLNMNVPGSNSNGRSSSSSPNFGSYTSSTRTSPTVVETES